MLRRSLIASIVVGTLLVALNQGDVLASGQWPSVLYWKIPLTYLIPFVVASWGALSTPVNSEGKLGTTRYYEGPVILVQFGDSDSTVALAGDAG